MPWWHGLRRQNKHFSFSNVSWHLCGSVCNSYPVWSLHLGPMFVWISSNVKLGLIRTVLKWAASLWLPHHTVYCTHIDGQWADVIHNFLPLGGSGKTSCEHNTDIIITFYVDIATLLANGCLNIRTAETEQHHWFWVTFLATRWILVQ